MRTLAKPRLTVWRALQALRARAAPRYWVSDIYDRIIYCVGLPTGSGYDKLMRR
jgi:hypothetical protein